MMPTSKSQIDIGEFPKHTSEEKAVEALAKAENASDDNGDIKSIDEEKDKKAFKENISTSPTASIDSRKEEWISSSSSVTAAEIHTTSQDESSQEIGSSRDSRGSQSKLRLREARTSF